MFIFQVIFDIKNKVASNETQLIAFWTPASAGVTPDLLFVIPVKTGGKRRLRSSVHRAVSRKRTFLAEFHIEPYKIISVIRMNVHHGELTFIIDQDFFEMR
jgi:hypothetical protein